MSRVRLTAVSLSCLLAVAACSSSGGAQTAPPAASVAAVATAASAAPTAPPSTAASNAPSAAPSAQAAATPGSTAVPTTIDPCQLVTAQEASTLVGVTFGAGKENTAQSNMKVCTYGSPTGNDFNVLVAVAPDSATAKKNEQLAEAAMQKRAPAGFTVTMLAGFAPGVDATMARFSTSLLGKKVEGIGIYVVKGAVFFTITDVEVGGSIPSATAMQAQAMTALGRVP